MKVKYPEHEPCYLEQVTSFKVQQSLGSKGGGIEFSAHTVARPISKSRPTAL